MWRSHRAVPGPIFDRLESFKHSVSRHETDWGMEYFFASLVKGDGVERPQRGMQRNGGINRNERSTGRVNATIEVAERGTACGGGIVNTTSCRGTEIFYLKRGRNWLAAQPPNPPPATREPPFNKGAFQKAPLMRGSWRVAPEGLPYHTRCMSRHGDIPSLNTVENGSGHCPAIRRCSWRFAPLRLLLQ